MDFVWGVNAASKLYQPIIKIIKGDQPATNN
jgi:hypothetical protein